MNSLRGASLRVKKSKEKIPDCRSTVFKGQVQHGHNKYEAENHNMIKECVSELYTVGVICTVQTWERY